MVTWKTSDPASGTVVSYTNDGTANTGFVSEQTEPLGQSVALTDPEPPNEPSTYEQHLFFASDPEWQCEAVGLGAYGSFFKDRPEHCQRKALYAAGAYLPWEGEVTNVLKISKRLQVTRLPEILFGGASGHEIMRRTLSITNKFASGGPSSGGDGGWSQTGEHEWEVTAYEPFPSDIEQSLDPKNAGEPFTGGFSKHEKKVIEKALEKAEKLTQDAGCDEALKKYGIDSLNSLVQMYRPDGTNWESEILDGRDTKVNVQVGVDRETGGPIRETTINSPLIPAFVKEDGKTYINSTFFNYSRFGISHVRWFLFTKPSMRMGRNMTSILQRPERIRKRGHKPSLEYWLTNAIPQQRR